jgi:hypothetical protein
MRHLRSFAALLTIAAITVACSPGAGSGGESQGAQPSTGSQPSQAAASSGGGGGGGGGANGSMTYEITGDYEASGELPFLAGGVSLWIEQSEGWAAFFGATDGSGAVIQINTQSGEGTPGQIWNFGDGTAAVTATSDPGSGSGCTFTLTKNDSSGTAGSVECSSAIVTNLTTGTIGQARVSAEWTGHN